MIITLAMLLAASSFADTSQVGTLTRVQGDVKLFTHPGKKLSGPPPHALYEGLYYTVRDAGVGNRLEEGSILRTAPGAGARVIYDNGDLISVGPGTAYRITSAKKDAPELELRYGKLRGVVEKGGPRSTLKIRTRSAVMGVRGTDFFVAEGDGGAEISVLRGTVAVNPVKGKAVVVTAGRTADVDEKKVTAKLRPTSKQDLAAIVTASSVKAAEGQPPEMVVLEAKSRTLVMVDIEKTDPGLAKRLNLEKATDIDAVNNAVVESLTKDAPSAPAKRKPHRTELEDLEKGAYEKYFKIVD